MHSVTVGVLMHAAVLLQFMHVLAIIAMHGNSHNSAPDLLDMMTYTFASAPLDV